MVQTGGNRSIYRFRMKQFTPDLSVHETRLDTNIINNKHFRAMKSLNEKFTQNEMTT